VTEMSCATSDAMGAAATATLASASMRRAAVM
jgi:hypothetical protein